MTPDDKKKFDAVTKLRDMNRDSFDHRTNREWKMCITLWTACLAFIALVLTDKVEGLPTWGVAGASVVMLAAYTFWLCRLHAAHRFDQRFSSYWQERMEDVAQEQLPADLKKLRTSFQSRRWLLRWYSAIYQIVITALLLGFCVVTVRLKLQ